MFKVSVLCPHELGYALDLLTLRFLGVITRAYRAELNSVHRAGFTKIKFALLYDLLFVAHWRCCTVWCPFDIDGGARRRIANLNGNSSCSKFISWRLRYCRFIVRDLLSVWRLLCSFISVAGSDLVLLSVSPKKTQRSTAGLLMRLHGFVSTTTLPSGKLNNGGCQKISLWGIFRVYQVTC